MKPSEFETYREFYDNGFVGFEDESLHAVRSVVDSNWGVFEVEQEDLEAKQDEVKSDEQLEDARLFCPDAPDNTCVLLTTPTGTATYNLNAATIHTTFSIGKDTRLPYIPLGDEKVNSLRTKFS